MKFHNSLLIIVAGLAATSSSGPVSAEVQQQEKQAAAQAVEAIEDAAQQVELQVLVEAVPVQAPAEEEPQTTDKDDAGKKSEKEKEDKEALRKRMQELENELAQKRNEYQKKAREEQEKKRAQAKNKVKDIMLPENPTREQSAKFIGELREAAKHVNSYSSSDPIVGKLKEVPVEHFDLLIGEIQNRTKLRYFCNYAMRDIDTEVLRERFVKSVDKSENAIAVIVMHGWVEDVRDSVIKRMETADGTLSPAWFQAAVELEEPSLYPKLHEITINSRSATQFLTMLQTLPDYDLAHTVNVCWKRSRENKLSISSSTISSMATDCGNVEALGSFIGQLRYSQSYVSRSSSYNSRRLKVLRYIDYRGSNKDILAWYEKNKDKLVFDHYRKRYVLPDSAGFTLPKDPNAQDKKIDPDATTSRGGAVLDAEDAVEDVLLDLDVQLLEVQESLD